MQLKQRCYAINGCCAAVHRELGPFLNEYMYQDALQILLDEQQIPYQREYYFSVVFHGKPIQQAYTAQAFRRFSRRERHHRGVQGCG